jgi:hypothetical protein
LRVQVNDCKPYQCPELVKILRKACCKRKVLGETQQRKALRKGPETASQVLTMVSILAKLLRLRPDELGVKNVAATGNGSLMPATRGIERRSDCIS